MKLLFISIFIFLFIGCTEEVKVDSKKILETSCAKCHNLSMPPQIPEVELAPPMMAVVFHLKDFIKTANPSEHKSKFTLFVSDYILNPTEEKAFCDKKSIKQYGLMPSLKKELTSNEATKVAQYIYDKYDPQKFYKEQKIKREFEALPKGEQLVRKNGCMSCHSISKVKIAPSFKNISKQSTKEKMQNSLLNGSKGSYNGFEKSYMPPLGKNLEKKDLDIIINWISNFK